MVTRGRLDPTVRQSILERLLDDEPGIAEDPHPDWDSSVVRKRNSLRRDLEWLLNTRRIHEEAPDALTELRSSVYHYGLPDLSSLSADSPETRRLLLREVEDCIRIFEPRLRQVRVIARPLTDGSHRNQVRFVIEALMDLDPEPEKVTFDTVLEATSGAVSLEAEGDA